jgi:hypothetical protein
MAAPVQAYTVSARVGPLLNQAMAMIEAKDYKAATAKLAEAESVKVSADDEAVINQFRQVIQIKTLVCRPGEHYRVVGKSVEHCPNT